MNHLDNWSILSVLADLIGQTRTKPPRSLTNQVDPDQTIQKAGNLVCTGCHCGKKKQQFYFKWLT